MRLTKLANWLSEGDLARYQQQAQLASTVQAQLKKKESELNDLKRDFQEVQKELARSQAQLQINQGFQQELGETQLKLGQCDREAQRYKKELFEQTKSLNLLQTQLTQAQKTVARSQNWVEQIVTSIQVLDIKKTLPKSDFDTLWGFGIISPNIKSTSIAGAIFVQGWAIGKQAKAVTIRVIYDTEKILEVPIKLRRPQIAEQYPDIPSANKSGFEFPLSVAGISDVAEFNLEAVLEDRTVVPLCAITVQPSPTESKDT